MKSAFWVLTSVAQVNQEDPDPQGRVQGHDQEKQELEGPPVGQEEMEDQK